MCYISFLYFSCFSYPTIVLKKHKPNRLLGGVCFFLLNIENDFFFILILN